MYKVTVVEDDALLNRTLSFNLRMEGYETISFFSCKEARDGITAGSADLLIMDVNLGDGSGFDLVKENGAAWSVPVIFLTANDMESDMLKGYELGAEDYVTKPFSIPVLLKKCAVVLARAGAGTSGSATQSYDDGYLIIDFESMHVTRGGIDESLTPLELRMLKIFASSGGSALTRELLIDRLWDSDGNFVDEHTLTTNINRLRGKIEDEKHKYIRTIYGMGYMWVGE